MFNCYFIATYFWGMLKFCSTSFFNCLSVVSAEFKTVQRRPTEYSITWLPKKIDLVNKIYRMLFFWNTY